MESLFIDDPVPQYHEAEKLSARVIGKANIFLNPNAFTPSGES